MSNDYILVIDTDVVRYCIGAYLDQQLLLVDDFVKSISDKVPNFSKKYEKFEKLKLYADRTYKFYFELARKIIASGGLDIDLSRINHLDNSGDQILMSRVRVQDELASQFAGNPPSYRIYKSSKEEMLTVLHNDIVNFKDLPAMIYIDNIALVPIIQMNCKDNFSHASGHDAVSIAHTISDFGDDWSRFSLESFKKDLSQRLKSPEFKYDMLAHGLVKLDCITDTLILNSRLMFCLHDGLKGLQKKVGDDQSYYGARSTEIANACQEKIVLLESGPGVKSMMNAELLVQEYKNMTDWESVAHAPEVVLLAYDIRPNWLTCMRGLLEEYIEFENVDGTVN